MNISSDIKIARRIGEEKAIKLFADAGFTNLDYTLLDFSFDDSILNTDRWKEHIKYIKDYAYNLGIKFNQAHAPFEFDWTEKM